MPLSSGRVVLRRWSATCLRGHKEASQVTIPTGRWECPHAESCICQADVLVVKCYWTLIQKQYFLLFWFCRSLGRLCNEWWYSGRSGDLTTPDHSPSQREVLRQGGWEQSRIPAREEHGTRPSPGLQHDGAKKEGVHDSAESCKRSPSLRRSSSFQCFWSVLHHVCHSVYLNAGHQGLVHVCIAVGRIPFSSSSQTRLMKSSVS